MAIPSILIWVGTALTVAGLIALGYCIVRALAIRRSGADEAGAAEMQRLVAVNFAAVGIAAIGLSCVVVGVIL